MTVFSLIVSSLLYMQTHRRLVSCLISGYAMSTRIPAAYLLFSEQHQIVNPVGHPLLGFLRQSHNEKGLLSFPFLKEVSLGALALRDRAPYDLGLNLEVK